MLDNRFLPRARTILAFLAVLASLALGASTTAHAFYTWVDENGVKHFESRKPPERKPELPQNNFDENTKEYFRERAREAAAKDSPHSDEMPETEEPESLLDKGLAFFGLGGVREVDETPPPSEPDRVHVQDEKPAGATSVRAKAVLGKPKVDLYVTSWCPWCRKAEEFFKEKGVPYAVYDIEKDPAARKRKKALDTKRGIPFVMIGEVGVHGYNPDAYDEALKGLD